MYNSCGSLGANVKGELKDVTVNLSLYRPFEAADFLDNWHIKGDKVVKS